MGPAKDNCLAQMETQFGINDGFFLPLFLREREERENKKRRKREERENKKNKKKERRKREEKEKKERRKKEEEREKKERRKREEREKQKCFFLRLPIDQYGPVSKMSNS